MRHLQAKNMKISMLKGHFPIIVMMGSSGMLFVSNFLARRYFSSVSYEVFAYILTLATIASSFALLGAENLVIRFGRLKDGKVSIPKNVIKITISSFIAALLACGLISSLIVPGNLSLVLVISLSLSIGSCLYLYNINRLQERFILSQISLGSWRIALFFVVLWIVFSGSEDQLAIYMAACMFLLVIFTGLGIISAITVEGIEKDAAQISLGFSFSLGVMTVLGGFDRVLASHLEGPNDFADYVYITMFLIFPLNMVCSYLGMKEGVYFKRHFNWGVFVGKLKESLSLVVVLYLTILFFCWMARDFLRLDFGLGMALACLVLAALKGMYAIASSAMGALGTLRQIWLSNLFSAAVIAPIFLLAYLLSEHISIEGVVWVFVLMWGFRVAAFVYYIRRSCREV